MELPGLVYEIRRKGPSLRKAPRRPLNSGTRRTSGGHIRDRLAPWYSEAQWCSAVLLGTAPGSALSIGRLHCSAKWSIRHIHDFEVHYT